ncbi:hypothetical protein [Terriglobus sp. RCC_193]|uniref:hypothetical protein n=1 Tax=Terriglobus sp. RCC_193 TaxID=3239218 RepID=UPI003523F69E
MHIAKLPHSYTGYSEVNSPWQTLRNNSAKASFSPVGITPPKKNRERTAARYITGMLALTVASAAAMFAFILSRVL